MNMKSSDLEYATRFARAICRVAGSPSLLDDMHASMQRSRVDLAVRRRDTPRLFDYLVSMLSFQGVSDAVAQKFMETHGSITWSDIDTNLSERPACAKLQGYWTFHRCQYRKDARSCAHRKLLPRCPLPAHQLRNGRLNQMAYSLYFFLRDVADGDLVGWIDARIAESEDANACFARAGEPLLSPLRNVFGVSDKVLTMALSTLLLSNGRRRPKWAAVGGAMIVIDTLVHNFLHRTGVLRRFDAEHAFGAPCYRPGACADIVEAISERIDAKEFNHEFPSKFPRFVQHAIWRYCAQAGLDTCNGNRIDDRASCRNMYCRLFDYCDRVPLRRSS